LWAGCRPFLGSPSPSTTTSEERSEPHFSVIKNGVAEQQLPTIEEACQLADSLTVGEAGTIEIRDDETAAIVRQQQWEPSGLPFSQPGNAVK
jgi:hypothetical protein